MHEVAALADRLLARSSSVVLADLPETQNDLRLAALILRQLLDSRAIFCPIEIEVRL